MLLRANRFFLPFLLSIPTLAAACGDGSVAEPRASRAALDRAPECTSTAGIPDELRCTGLYADWASRTIDPTARMYSPGFELWSDGAKKTRFIQLPPGARTKIDVRDMNNWVFPVGTKLWKEFRLDGVQIETRTLHKTAPNKWDTVTYVWSADQTSAKRVTTGIMPFPGTTSYEVPSERMCNRCHANRGDHVLGFEAALLAAPESTGLTYQKLLDDGLLDAGDQATPPKAAALAIPGEPVEREAIGRLHANCGIACHNPDGPAPFSMRLDVIGGALPPGVEGTAVFKEAIGEQAFFSPPNGEGTYYRIRPTDEERSMIFYRMSQRDAPAGHDQMPPIATHKTDQALMDATRAWIRSMNKPPYPTAGPI